MAQASEVQEKNPKKVQEIAKGFLVMGDEMLAHKMQNEEYGKKYEFNRGERQVARKDVPLAMMAHNEEELKLQRDNFERLENLKKLAEQDEELARQLQENESATLKRKHKKLQPVEMVSMSATMNFQDDQEIVRLNHQKMELEKQKDKIQQEIKDQEFAIELHNKELKKYLSHARRTNSVQSSDVRSAQIQPINEGKLGGKVISLSMFDGFQVGDDNDITEEERRELIRMQDEELARALQMSEQMKATRKKHTGCNDMERKDAELARLMQQTENMHIQRSGSTSTPYEGMYLGPTCCSGSHSSSGIPHHSLENALNHRVCPQHQPITNHHHHHHPISSSPLSNFNSLEQEEMIYENADRIVGARREYSRSQSLFQKSSKK